jgi:hypothetical protein
VRRTRSWRRASSGSAANRLASGRNARRVTQRIAGVLKVLRSAARGWTPGQRERWFADTARAQLLGEPG